MATIFRSSHLVSRTTTGLSDLLSFTQWSEQAEPGWPNPEQSIGRFIKKMGKISCWEATGPAREAFIEIAPEIKDYLDQSVEPLSTWVTWSVYMFGKSPQTASPTIVFCCGVAAHRKEIKNLILDSGILDGYQGFKTAHMPTPPDFQQLVPLAYCEERLSACNIEAYISEGYSYHRSGMRIFVGISRLPATIGGIIQVGDKFFYTTAGHVFHPFADDGLKRPGEGTASEGDDDIEIDGFDASDFEDEESDDNSEITAGVENSLFRKTPGQHPAMPGQISNDRSLFNPPSKVLSTGAPFLTSFDGADQDDNLDYALIEITHPVLHKVNEIMDQDFLRTREVEKIRVKSLIGRAPNGEKVLAITSKRVIEGTISGTPVYSRHPLGSQFRDAFSVSFSSALEVGDCGSWVVNAGTGALYGHIVAGSPGMGSAIVVPFQSIFEDIESRTGHLPQLPAAAKDSSGPDSPSQHLQPVRPLFATSTHDMETRFKELVRAKLAQSTLHKKKSGDKQRLDLLPRPPDPYDERSQLFRERLYSLIKIPLQWEEPGILDEALKLMPLDQIYKEAEEETQHQLARTTSQELSTCHEWGYQDFVIQAVLRWFKRSFFTWVTTLPCKKCRSSTIAIGLRAPTAEETIGGALHTELYMCSNQACGEYVRFPRYRNVRYILHNRRGRWGEWTNCFGVFCRAVGAKTRLVANAENNAWLEVFSEHQYRWVHVDPCEEIWDMPGIYTEGWGKKMSYCIALGKEGLTDVTRRYVRTQSNENDRNMCPEAVLLYILQEITTLLRKDMAEETKADLEESDREEQQELSAFFVERLIFGMFGRAPLPIIWPKRLKKQLDPSGESRGGEKQKEALPTPKKVRDSYIPPETAETTKNGSHNTPDKLLREEVRNRTTERAIPALIRDHGRY